MKTIVLVLAIAVAANAATNKWEYRIVELFHLYETAQLDDLGSQGWELIAPIGHIVSGKQTHRFIFKRPSAGQTKDPQDDISSWLQSAALLGELKRLPFNQYRFGLENKRPTLWLAPSHFENAALLKFLNGLAYEPFGPIQVFELLPDGRSTTNRLGEIVRDQK